MKKEITLTEEWAEIVNKMDPDIFATAIICEKFWEWAKDPDKTTAEKLKNLLAKKYNIKENCELMMMMIAFIAGADAGSDIAAAIMSSEATA